MKRWLIPASVIALMSLACGICGIFVPSPTERTVTPDDISGTYTYAIDNDPAHDVTVHLNADGTVQFENSQRWHNDGTWRLDENHIRIDFSDGTIYSQWWVYDLEDGTFGIFGGESVDPDGWALSGLQRVKSPADTISK